MKGYILAIDTHESGMAAVSLTLPGGKPDTEVLKGKFRSEDILPLIISLCERHGIHASGLDGISVHTGPGSFTGLRIGIMIARMLGLLYRIPVNGQPATAEIRPVYLKSKYD